MFLSDLRFTRRTLSAFLGEFSLLSGDCGMLFSAGGASSIDIPGWKNTYRENDRRHPDKNILLKHKNSFPLQERQTTEGTVPLFSLSQKELSSLSEEI